LSVDWVVEGTRKLVTISVPIYVTQAADTETEFLALRALGEPQMQAQLVLGGDGLEKARTLLADLLKNPQLGPHYAYIEARRLARRHLGRAPAVDEALQLLDGAVLSAAEVRAAQDWRKRAFPEQESDGSEA
jgi:hypothetical protein